MPIQYIFSSSMKIKLLPLGAMMLPLLAVTFIIIMVFTGSRLKQEPHPADTIFYILFWSTVSTLILGFVEKISQSKYVKFLWIILAIIVVFLLISGIYSGIFLHGHLNDSLMWSFK